MQEHKRKQPPNEGEKNGNNAAKRCMGKNMSCNRNCINCQKEYCTKVYRDSSRYCNRSEEAKQHNRDYQKKKRDEAKKQGLCIVCRKKSKSHGAKCYECYLRQKRYDRQKYDGRRQRWKDNGKCYFCGKDVVPGKKVCADHYQRLIRNIETCNSHKNTRTARMREKNEMQILWKRN